MTIHTVLAAAPVPVTAPVSLNTAGLVSYLQGLFGPPSIVQTLAQGIAKALGVH
jgi:hypothetical protein